MVNLVFSTGEASMSLDVAVRAKALCLSMDYSLFPESGLHPSNHTAITEAMLGKDIWVATHSEVLILRALRMLRERRATTSDFALWQYRGNCMVQIELSEDGNFLDHIQGGFFEEGFKERFA